MKRIWILILMVILVSALYVMAQEQRGSGINSAPAGRQENSQGRSAGIVNKPVVVNMNRPSSGENNRNFPAQQKPSRQQVKQQSPGQRQNIQPAGAKPSMNQNNPRPVQPDIKTNAANNSGVLRTREAASKNGNVAAVLHHHPYEVNYIRSKLKKIGVTSEPGYITNREEVIHTDRAHSTIAYPKTGIDNRNLRGTAVSPRNFNDQVVRSQMSRVSGSDWQDRVRGFNQSENQTGRYFWHKDNNFDYCHYVDNSGYDWYGWYSGNSYFWTRNFNDRWWWYDADFDRWCFWNNGFWWWQDPYHMGDIYCYNDADYIPCNSAEDNVAVTVPDDANMRSFTSPDKTRVVKVVADTKDAFLYDTAKSPAFNPVYLASGVADVQFSDTGNGRGLEIMLKLGDSSYDMFDANGNAYNSGNPEGN